MCNSQTWASYGFGAKEFQSLQLIAVEILAFYNSHEVMKSRHLGRLKLFCSEKPLEAQVRELHIINLFVIIFNQRRSMA